MGTPSGTDSPNREAANQAISGCNSGHYVFESAFEKPRNGSDGKPEVDQLLITARPSRGQLGHPLDLIRSRILVAYS
jgi:hypothetical protein